MLGLDFSELGADRDYVSLPANAASLYLTDQGTMVEEVVVSAARTNEAQPWAVALGLLVLVGLAVALTR